MDDDREPEKNERDAYTVRLYYAGGKPQAVNSQAAGTCKEEEDDAHTYSMA